MRSQETNLSIDEVLYYAAIVSSLSYAITFPYSYLQFCAGFYICTSLEN